MYNLINTLLRRSAWYNNILFPDCRKFWKQSHFNLDIVNLGSSSAKYAFSYDKFDIKSANWAMAPQSLSADFALLQNYYSYLKPEGATVIIPLCFFSSLGGADDDFDDKYYTLLKFSSIPHGSKRKKLKTIDSQINPIKYFPLWGIVYEIKHFLTCLKSSKTNEVDIKTSARMLIDSWMKEFSLYDLDNTLDIVNRDRFIQSKAVLSNIIDFCIKKSIKVVIVVPPATKCLLEYFSESALETYVESFVSEAVKKGVQYINYLNNDEFKDLDHFTNALFLNDKGADIFTNRVLSDLGII